MIVSHGKFVIKPEQVDRALELLTDMVEHTLKEPGCIHYDYYVSIHTPNVIMLFQEWESIESINQHFLTPHMNEFLQVLPELLESEVITHRYAVHDTMESDNFHEHESQGEIELELEEESVTLH